MPSLDEIRDRYLRGEGPTPMTIDEAIAIFGYHGTHFVNPDAHPDIDKSQMPNVDLLRRIAKETFTDDHKA